MSQAPQSIEAPVACSKCGCRHFDTVGRRRSCRNCGTAIVFRPVYRGPRCEACQGRLSVAHTGEWSDGQRERRLICENPECSAFRVPVNTIERLAEEEK